MQPIYVTKNLAAASSSGIGTISTAATPVTTINTGTLDTGRRVILWSSGSNISTTFRIVGTNESGMPQTETVTGSTIGSAVATVQDFKTITSVTATSAPLASTVTIGTNTQGGTVWKSVDLAVPVTTVAGGIVFSSTANSMVASVEYTFDGIFGVHPNPYYSAPVVFISTMFSSVAVNTNGAVNIDGQIAIPINAWRVTLTSSSSSAGSVYMTVLQSGA